MYPLQVVPSLTAVKPHFLATPRPLLRQCSVLFFNSWPENMFLLIVERMEGKEREKLQCESSTHGCLCRGLAVLPDRAGGPQAFEVQNDTPAHCTTLARALGSGLLRLLQDAAFNSAACMWPIAATSSL